MKLRLLSSILVLALVSLAAVSFKFPKLKSATVGLTGSQIMVDQAEVCMSDWFAFVYAKAYNENDDQFDWDQYKALMPDTTVLPEKYLFMVRMFNRLDNSNSLPKTYHLKFFFGENSYDQKGFFLFLTDEEKSGEAKSHLERFLRLPVVGITYKQAQEYLAWRQTLAQDQKNVQETGMKVRARMLTQKEWETYATSFGPRKTDNNTAQIDTVNDEGCYLLNVKVDKPCTSVLEGKKIYGEGVVGVYDYMPDRNNLYNLYGNVAEMTEVEGVAIGGSYKDYGISCAYNKTENYTKPEPWLGFRCVIEFY